MSTITKEAVFQAAEALTAAGKVAKVSAVREFLGKGSFTTINEYMREWREQQKGPEAPVREVAPETVVNRLMDFGNNLWAVATELAAESLRSERETLEQMKVQMEEEQNETVAFADNLANEVDLLRAKNMELDGVLSVEREAHEATRRMWQAETDEVIRLRVELESALNRLEDFKSQAARYENQYLRSEEENKKLLKSEAQREGVVARLEAEVENCRAEMKHQVEMLTHELDNEREKMSKAEKASAADRASAQSSQIEAATLKGKVESLEIQLAQQAKMIEAFGASRGKSADKKE